MGSKKIKIEGCCPYCKTKNSIRFVDCYYNNHNTPYAKNVAMCSRCENDEIEVKKINNRRYKVKGKW